MPRFAPAGLPQHVTQRGNYGQDVFFTDADRYFYLSLLDRHSAEHKVRVIAYTLMTNHVHLLVEPQTDDGLTIMMQCLQGEYSRATNERHRLRGQLWRHRYDACVMDEFHLGIALAYVELNPVRAGMTKTAVDYEWSSARAHTANAPPHALLRPPTANKFGPAKRRRALPCSAERPGYIFVAGLRCAMRVPVETGCQPAYGMTGTFPSSRE